MITSGWGRFVLPEPIWGWNDSSSTAKQLKLTEYTTMPAQEAEEISIEQSHNIADRNAQYSPIGRDYLRTLERMSAAERGEWKAAVEVVEESVLAFDVMGMDLSVPKDVLRAARGSDNWDEIDPENIESEVCAATDDELYRVEVPSPSYGCGEYDHVTYVRQDGREVGGVDLSEADEYICVNQDEAFVAKRELGDLSPESNNSSSLTAYYPDSDEKIHIEYNNGVIRDLHYVEGYPDVAPLDSEDGVEEVFRAIIDGDSEAEALEGWVPLAAEADSGNQQAMKEKVEQIVESQPDEVFIDSPLLACAINTGIAASKRYVAVPEENAEEVDDLLFNPDLY